MTRTALTLLTLLPQLSGALATPDCLKTDIAGDEYPAAREKIIEDGWQPNYFNPAFEGAPYTDWVITRNYAEVEACAGTGTAPCRFVFKSEAKATNYLLVFTQGEAIGIVTEHECTDSIEN